MREKNGFTLIELLVVTAVIALLLAVLIPVLAAVNDQAKTSVCTVNLKNVGMGIFQYAQDNFDFIVPAEVRRPDDARSKWEAILKFYDYVEAAEIVPGGERNFSGASVFRCTRGLPELVDYGKLKRCGDPRDPETSKARVRTFYEDPAYKAEPTTMLHSWYGVNMWYNDNYPFVRLFDRRELNLQRPHKITEIRRPQSMVGVFDGVWSWEGGHYWWYVSARHRQATSTNVLTLDGRAETYRREDLPMGHVRPAATESAAPANNLDWRLSEQ